MIVAVIPARGGSRRIPRKNLRLFEGRPMIAHSIACAKATGVFERVVVSTDDEEIAAVSREYGAETPFVRPPELATDTAGTTEVIAHAVAALQGEGATPDAVCCLTATAPLLRPADVIEGLRILREGAWRYVFAATTFPAPIFRSFRRVADGGVEMFFPEHFRTRSQDLPEALHDAGQFYWGRPSAWLERARIFDSTSTVVMIPRWRVQDIDTEEDFERAALMARLLATS